MSLHQLARQVQSQGRGDDKMLVHMTPGEVKGLQALALAHGGSLSVNPDTGLPEAGFLKNILPTVVGAGLAMTGVGMPFAIAAGAGTGLLTSGGNLKQGILGGLGAWGGASLAGSLMGAGAGALGAGAAESASLLGNAAIAGGETTAGMVGTANTGLPIGTQTLGGTVTAGGLGGGSAVGSAAAAPSATASIQEGFKQAAANPGAFFKQNMFPIGAAVAPALFGASDSTAIGPAPDQGQIRPYTYSQTRNPDFGKVPGVPYFSQSYTAGQPYAAASGGLVALAKGGEASSGKAGSSAKGGRFTDVDVQQLAAPVTTYGAQRTVAPAVNEFNRIIADRAANEYITQPALLNTLPGGGERATAEDTKKLINQYYLSNLGRQGEQEGLDYWTQQKMDTGMSLADINKAIAGSEEAKARKEALEGPKPVYFDPEFYAKQNPDIARVSEYRTDPFLHYQRHGFKEGRAGAEGYTGTEMLGLAPKPTNNAGQTGGYKYDPVTKTFSGGLPKPQQAADVFGVNLDDPNFQNYLQQQYNQYQQSLQVGAKAGGLMPKDLKFAGGGIADLGGYSDGGRMLKGPGDGMSDSIPGVIGGRQPARLADGEFVVPADVVSHLGNGSTDAGAKKLYSMMDRVRKARTGKKKQAPAVKTDRLLPA